MPVKQQAIIHLPAVPGISFIETLIHISLQYLVYKGRRICSVKRRSYIGISVIFLCLILLCSCSSNETIKCGSFDLAYPKDIDLRQKEASKVDSYRENYVYACYDDAAAYERNFLFSEEEDCVFTMELIYADLAQGDDIKKYASDMRASLMSHDRIWTLQSVIEEKDDSIIFKAAPYRKEIEDHGVFYCRYFLKDDGVGFARIIVREEADDKYGKIIESILKKLK